MAQDVAFVDRRIVSAAGYVTDCAENAARVRCVRRPTFSAMPSAR